MPYSGGTYTLSDTIANGTPEDATELQAILDDIATALNLAFLRDGSAVATGQFLGVVSATAQYSFSGDTNTGFGSDTGDEIYMKGGGVKTWAVNATGGVLTGTLAVSGNVAINTDKFTVAAASGNTVVAGTLGVTGATTLTGLLTTNGGISVAGGDFAINTNKFTVTASSGNTAVAGTLAVTGAISGPGITASAALTGATAAGAMIASQAEALAASATNKLITPGRFHFHISAAKTVAEFDQAGTHDLSVNRGISSITDAGVGKSGLQFSTSFATSSYAWIGTARGLLSANGNLSANQSDTKDATALTVAVVDDGNSAFDSGDVNVVTFGDY